ncbi:regulatory protein GntR [Mycolicibacterium flavescens]|uniref:GntR family transcriptional regulator n=1 Tax=Mycobacterium neumannii TaxID=2048551 RepID=UPI000B93D959|nr:GntR family transcriptional regulator [Mycobacterium neumannii]VEG43685.1 regulatory protein GntR [Mycolicibacterium flavescens]
MTEVRTDYRYLQVEHALRRDIANGVYPVGSRLPTEHELCRLFSVSRYTVRAALRGLRDDKLVYSQPRSGTLVLEPPSRACRDTMTIEDLLKFAASSRLIIESLEFVTITPELQDRTGLRADQKWLSVSGFRMAERGEIPAWWIPTWWMEYYINPCFADVGRLLGNHVGPVLTLIEDVFGVAVVEAAEEVAATVIAPELAAGLNAPRGAPALQIRRTYSTSEGMVAQVTIDTYPASRFRRSLTIQRD